jgi:hypothetical protein
VEIIPSTQFAGPWYKTQTYSVPEDVSPTDPRNWAIQMQQTEEGRKLSSGN